MLYLLCDESGAKGYADNEERTAGEFGLIAGYLLTPQELLDASRTLDHLLAPIYDTHGTTHITDLPREKQQPLREAVIRFLKDERFPVVYDAISVQGFHDAHQEKLDMAERAKAGRRSAVKPSGNVHVPSLHCELLSGLLLKAMATAADTGRPHDAITIITDTIDSGVLRDALEDLRASVRSTHEHHFTGYDPGTKQVRHATLTTQLPLDDLVDPASILLESQDSSLTRAADVLANSLHHHLAEQQAAKPGTPLNTQEAIATHPLAGQIYGIRDSASSMPDPADFMYPHPRNPSS